ncbi:hypothetical protein BFF78_08995 [Streptomyces fodineus]|uniref:Uncharacterized protein n=1 Tax=Streptomyces fodineus TaxID=1904616 RepID=A0A1D7YN41_9ACTN|nr:hypothetical protein [Streptomyces fodineus]AOR36976.1 hypothetical protein BFF78_08995 [Streptomyces fodineus]
MDGAELVERLREAAVPEAFYEIAGVHDVPVQPDAYYFLRPEADAWTVGLRQRSKDSVIRRFATEAEACQYLYDTLTRLPSRPSGPVEPLEKLLANTEEIQRQAWEDFWRHQ